MGLKNVIIVRLLINTDLILRVTVNICNKSQIGIIYVVCLRFHNTKLFKDFKGSSKRNGCPTK